MEIEYGEAVRREAMLQRTVLETKAEFDRLNARSFEYQALKREAEADKGLYEELVRKIKEAGINVSFQNSSIRIADSARPAVKPVFPNLKLNLLLAFLFSSLLAVGIAVYLERMTISNQFKIVDHPGWAFRLMAVLTLTTGTAFIMWLGEQITERGIGNGMSLIIFAGIVVGLPRAVIATFEQLRTGQMGLIRLLLLAALMVVVVAAIIFVERGHRRVMVQYAKRVVGRRMYGGSSTHIPLKVNTGGVIPVIFASSIIAFPVTILQMLPSSRAGTGWVAELIRQLGWGNPLYNLLYVAGIIFFAYFYTAIIFNPDDVAENMRKYGGFIPGIRPGKRTAEYIDTILTRITLAGAIYLACVAIIPEFLITGFKVAPIPFIGERLDAMLPRFITEGMNVQFYFGGTSLLIVVGVAMDTVQQIESQLIMRHYDGFMKKTRIRGRRD